MIDVMRRRLLALVLAPLCLVPLAGCGYSLAGRGSALPTHIKTIGIPLFSNATSVFDVEQTLTAMPAVQAFTHPRTIGLMRGKPRPRKHGP